MKSHTYILRKLGDNWWKHSRVSNANGIVFKQGIEVREISYHLENNTTYVTIEGDFDTNDNGRTLEVF